jgi:hypothetical protein
MPELVGLLVSSQLDQELPAHCHEKESLFHVQSPL